MPGARQGFAAICAAGKTRTGAVFNSLNHRQTPSYPPVQDLLNKIEAAAEARLSFSPNATAAERLARYKTFLKVEAHRLKLLHRAGVDGRGICQARAAIWIVILAQRHCGGKARALQNLSQGGGPSPQIVASCRRGRTGDLPGAGGDFGRAAETSVGVSQRKFIRAGTKGISVARIGGHRRLWPRGTESAQRC